MSRRKVILLLFAGFTILVIGLVIYSLIPRSTILLSVAPNDFTVTVNGKTHRVKTGQSLTVSPGEMIVEISEREFEPHIEKFAVKNGETYELLFALTPITDAAKTRLQTRESQAVIQRIAGNNVQEGAAQIAKEYPLFTELPIIDRYYKVVVCDSVKYPQDRTKFAVCIQLFDLQARRAAINEVESLGYKLSDYETIFVDMTYKNIKKQAGD